jgi:hypothetical protein
LEIQVEAADELLKSGRRRVSLGTFGWGIVCCGAVSNLLFLGLFG